MKNIVTKAFLFFAVLTFNIKYSYAQVSITDSATASQLVQTLVGSGINFSNATFKCKENAEGIFTVTTSNLGLTGGIILSTGNAEGASTSSLTQPDNCNESGERGQWSDPDLDTLVTVGTHDACVLEFDFVPDGDSLLFDYVFGSEEYDNFSCTQFNDVFGFFLSGPGITGAPNIALIPGTNIPVAINSTTDPAITQPGSLIDCINMGPGSPFAQYYKDNQTMQTIAYYGMTQILTARAAVIPCTTYHIKLAIADGGDCVLSSGVFLEANSFRSTNIRIDLNSSLSPKDSLLIEGCADSSRITIKRNTPFPIPQTIFLSYTGSAIRGTDYNFTPDSVIIPANDTIASFFLNPFQDNIQEGIESIVINLLNPCNKQVIDSAVFLLRDVLPATLLSVDTFMCGKAPVRLQIAGDPDFEYLWTSTPVSNIESPNSQFTVGFPDSTTTYFIRGSYLGCFTDTFSFKATVEPTPIVEILNEERNICLGDPLKLKVNVEPDYYKDYNYLWFPPTGLNDPYLKEPDFFVSEPGVYSLTLAVQTATLGCTGIDTITFRVRPAAVLTDVSPDFTIRYGDQMQLNANGVLYYIWTPTTNLDYPNTNNPTVTGLDPTTFTLIGINEFGCTDTAYVKMDVDYTMHEIIPNAFSPNGDGRNDIFSVKNMKFQRLVEFKIYNRWGQEVFGTNDYKIGWDGTYKGVAQETGVYNYVIRVVIPNGQQRIYKGDVTLVR